MHIPRCGYLKRCAAWTTATAKDKESAARWRSCRRMHSGSDVIAIGRVGEASQDPAAMI